MFDSIDSHHPSTGSETKRFAADDDMDDLDEEDNKMDYDLNTLAQHYQFSDNKPISSTENDIDLSSFLNQTSTLNVIFDKKLINFLSKRIGKFQKHLNNKCLVNFI